MKKLSLLSRIVMAAISLLLCGTYFLPVWRIDLFAPQYPEGLFMNIWLKRISGDVDIINGLNHYIGMKVINAASFPEFRYLVYIVAFYIALGLLVAITGRVKFLLLYLGLSIIGGLLALYDFYQWGFAYGHNLNPDAPIKVPGLSYQPPVFGHKQLLNFDAYSMPDIGGWLVIVAGCTAFGILLLEWLKYRKARTKKIPALTLAWVMSAAASCTPGAAPIKYGTDSCYTCKMGLTDTRYGCELVTKKGKVFKFDDAVCMIRHLKTNTGENKDFRLKLFINYEEKNKWLEAEKAFLVVWNEIKSPMGSNVMAFKDVTSAATALKGTSYTPVTWEALYNSIK
jgi:copper chaperone NosL